MYCDGQVFYELDVISQVIDHVTCYELSALIGLNYSI